MSDQLFVWPSDWRHDLRMRLLAVTGGRELFDRALRAYVDMIGTTAMDRHNRLRGEFRAYCKSLEIILPGLEWGSVVVNAFDTWPVFETVRTQREKSLDRFGQFAPAIEPGQFT
jgi:hypothetical protein